LRSPAIVSYQLSAISYQLSAISYQLSAISYQLSAVSYQLSAISYQLSAISYQLSAISYQLSQSIVDGPAHCADHPIEHPPYFTSAGLHESNLLFWRQAQPPREFHKCLQLSDTTGCDMKEVAELSLTSPRPSLSDIRRD